MFVTKVYFIPNVSVPVVLLTLAGKQILRNTEKISPPGIQCRDIQTTFDIKSKESWGGYQTGT